MDTDLALLTVALGALMYGIYLKSVSNNAGYDVTPPPQLERPTPVALPGVPGSLLIACEKVVDAPGSMLAGPVAPKGMEPDRLKELIAIVVKRIAMDVICTGIDGGSCVADSEGSEQYDLTCMLYEKNTNVAVQMNVGILALDDGRVMVSKLSPATRVETNTLANGDPWTLDLAPYSLPIDGV